MNVYLTGRGSGSGRSGTLRREVRPALAPPALASLATPALVVFALIVSFLRVEQGRIEPELAAHHRLPEADEAVAVAPPVALLDRGRKGAAAARRLDVPGVLAALLEQALAFESEASISRAPSQLNDQSPAYRSVIFYKGAYVYHMLRSTIGDDKFFSLIKTYYTNFHGKNAGIDDFEALADKAAGSRRNMRARRLTATRNERTRERIAQGTELQRGFMLNYNLYRHYFPLMALGRARKFLHP